MISRRGLVRGAAAAAVAVPAASLLASQADGAASRPGAAPRSPRRGAAAGLPLQIVNKTGSHKNSSIWVYIVGNDGKQQVRVTPEGELKPVAEGDNGPGGFTDYAIPLSGSG